MSEPDDCPTIRLDELLHCLLECSEKAARIARTFRSQDDLFGLLVEKKSEIQKTQQIRVQDFKTLADVLVQQTIKRDVGQKFPALSSKIQGEEQNSFQNTLGECIKVELTDSQEETSSLLCKVLNGKVHIAESLASIVHSEDAVCDRQYSSSVTIPADRLGVWIDPIDSTAEYIQAKQNTPDENGIELCGLKCVCVLIGVYDLETGIPLMGIINQPFYKESFDTASRWESNIYWGINYDSEKEVSTSLQIKDHETPKVVVTSTFENEGLQSIMQTKYSVVHAAGAGYKGLVVAKTKANLYVLSLQNTHFWDTCGPHAILAALGGGIVSFKQIVKNNDVDHSSIQNYQLKYLGDDSNSLFKNHEGLIAYRDPNDLLEFLELLRENRYDQDHK